jgi:hypothetical protein
MQSGRAVVLPGLINRAGAIGGQLTPRRVLMPLMSRLYPAMKA